MKKILKDTYTYMYTHTHTHQHTHGLHSAICQSTEFDFSELCLDAIIIFIIMMVYLVDSIRLILLYSTIKYTHTYYIVHTNIHTYIHRYIVILMHKWNKRKRN